MIKSRRNPLIQRFIKYKTKVPLKEEKAILEGTRLIGEAVKSNVVFEALFFTTSLLKSGKINHLLQKIKSQVPVFEMVSEEVMKALSLEETPPGLWAFVKMSHSSTVKSKNKIVVLCGLQDPGNAGTLIRTAEAGGASIWFSEESVHPFHPKVLKASMGSAFRVPLGRGALIPFLEELKNEHWTIIGTQAKRGIKYDDWDWKPPFALLLGNEARGLSPKIDPLLDIHVTIPLRGELESLNVATAGAILLFHAFLQERKTT